MSFNIFVYGLTGNLEGGGRKAFHYSKDDCPDRSDFEPSALLSMVPATPNANGVAKKIAGTSESHLTKGIINGLSIIAEMECAHLIRTEIDLLAMHGTGGQISLYCLQKNWYWSDTNTYVTFRFNSSTNPGRDFLKAIGPGLVKTALNNFGVLAQIAIVLSNYNTALPGNSSPHLEISLSH